MEHFSWLFSELTVISNILLYSKSSNRLKGSKPLIRNLVIVLCGDRGKELEEKITELGPSLTTSEIVVTIPSPVPTNDCIYLPHIHRV